MTLYAISDKNVKNRLFYIFLKECNLTLNQMQNFLAVTKSTLSRVLQNKHVSDRSLQKIARFFLDYQQKKYESTDNKLATQLLDLVDNAKKIKEIEMQDKQGEKGNK
jgi:uncharacterized protein YcbK (DUF882 family)